MHITAIRVYSVTLPYPHGTFHLTKGRSYNSFDDTIVEIETDEGLSGWGETCPFGTTFIEASPQGARAAIEIMAPHLLGADPRRPAALYQLMDDALVGHGYAKSALDMACWDLLGKAAGLPLCDLWGGRLDGPIPIERDFLVGDMGHVSGDKQLDVLREQIRKAKSGNTREYSMKASGDIASDIEMLDLITREFGPELQICIDANGGWTFDEALRITHALRDRHIVYEQPCATYEECRMLRQRITQPIILDEVAVDLETALCARQDGLLDICSLKTARVGGLTKARVIRDLCVTLGVPIHIQCSWGAELTKAGMLHLSQSTPARYRGEFWNITEDVSIVTAEGDPQPVDGMLAASEAPGLGVSPLRDVLGEPVATYTLGESKR